MARRKKQADQPESSEESDQGVLDGEGSFGNVIEPETKKPEVKAQPEAMGKRLHKKFDKFRKERI